MSSFFVILCYMFVVDWLFVDSVVLLDDSVAGQEPVQVLLLMVQSTRYHLLYLARTRIFYVDS